jgi:RNA polymerase sigma-70 factor (ECF subfamily)
VNSQHDHNQQDTASTTHLLAGNGIQSSAPGGGTQSALQSELAKRFQHDVAELGDQIKRAAWRYSNQSADVDDLVQETLMRAWKAYGSFEAGSNFRAWVFRIMVNTWINGYRTAKRRPVERLTGDFTEEGIEYNTIVGAAEEHVLEQMPAPEIRHAMHALPESQRIVVYYAYIEGRKHKDISEIIGIPVGTVMSRLHRARNTLRSALNDYADQQGYPNPVPPSAIRAA